MDDQTVQACLTSLLECPICYDTPGPGTKSMAMCSIGHVVCYKCYKTMRRNSIDPSTMVCPKCRDKNFSLYQNNYLIYNLSEMLGLGKLINCSFPNCTFKGFVNAMKVHQQTCQYMPIYCINWQCDKKLGFHDMLNTHTACYEPLPIDKVEHLDDNQTKLTWSFKINFSDIFDMQQNCLKVPKEFKPILLQHPSNKDFRAYFYPVVATDEKLQMSMAWLNNTCNSPKDIQTLKPHMTIIYPSRFGDLGISSRERFWFLEDMANYTYSLSPPPSLQCILLSHQKTILLDRQEILNWLKWTPRDTCPKCNNSIINKGPHIYLYIDMIVNTQSV